MLVGTADSADDIVPTAGDGGVVIDLAGDRGVNGISALLGLTLRSESYLAAIYPILHKVKFHESGGWACGFNS